MSSLNANPPRRNYSEEIEEVPEDFCEPILASSADLFGPAESVDIDGVDWYLTSLLVTIDALLLELYRIDRARWSTFVTWFYEVDCNSEWACSLAETMFLIFIAIINVFIVVPIVNMNVRTPSRHSWRFWLMASLASLFLLDMIMVLQMADSITKTMDDDGAKYPVSHFWLVCTAMLLTIALNLRFVLLYGVFSVFTCSEQKTLESWSGLRSIVGLPPKKISKEYIKDLLNVRGLMKRTMYRQSKPDWTSDRFTTFKVVENAKDQISRYLERRRLAKIERMTSRNQFEGSITHMATEDVQQYLQIVDSEGKLWFKLHILWQKIMTWCDLIAEEPGIFEYTTWMKSAIGFCFLMLIYNCIKAIEIIFALDAAWDVGHNAAILLHDGLHNISTSTSAWDSSLHDLSSSQTYQELEESIAGSSEEVRGQIAGVHETLESFIPTGMTDSESYRNAAALLNMILMSSSRLAESSDFEDNKVVSAFFYADSLIRWLKYACWIGYPVGTFIGFYSIFQVMAQHKRMAMSLEYEDEVRSTRLVNKVDDEKLEMKDSLMGIDQKYPIGGAVYFFGVLMGTAVFQQHMFGALMTVFVAIFLNIKHFDVLLDFGGSIAIIYLIIIVTNFFCSHIIGDRILTQDGYKIRHPWMFFFFLFAFTLIHAVLGFLYALWRALLFFMVTTWMLNRLDVSLFTTGKRLDNGHYSFMSMLLLSRVIHLEKKSQRQEQEPEMSPLIRRQS